jgi:hypothetical protein
MKRNRNLLTDSYRRAVSGAVAILALLGLTCSTDLSSGTSGSETGNGRVIGCIVNSTGTHVSGVQVMLLPDTYDPCKSEDPVLLDTTDTSGSYSFSCHQGNYTLQSVHLHDRTRAYSDSVIVDTNEVEVPDDTLKSPGSITITLPQDGGLQDGYFYIPGTTIYSVPDKNNGSVVFDSVPAGRITAVCYAESSDDKVQVIRNNVQVIPDASVDILHPAWEYARPVYLNTSSSGVQISKNVTGFPLLLRLSKQNFTFDQSFGDGSDLLFTNSTGVPLPFEIEYWDTDEEKACVWVKTDTIRAATDSQYIVMLWGNPSADNASDGALVFDTANGYQGVWHLNENPSDGIRDRTFNYNDGTATGNEPRMVNGAISQALEFGDTEGGAESYIQLPDATPLDYHGAITISCWVRLNENSPDSFNIIGKYSFCEELIGNCIVSGYSLFCSSRRTIELRFGFGTDLFFYLESDSSISDTSWHCIAGILEHGRMTLFIDATRKVCDTPETPVQSTAPGFIGGKSFFDGADPFTGEIDEVRISNTVRSSDWIRLNYLNQRQNDALVLWK